MEPQEVVRGEVDAADRRFGADSGMLAIPIAAMELSRQFGCAFGRTSVVTGFLISISKPFSTALKRNS